MLSFSIDLAVQSGYYVLAVAQPLRLFTSRLKDEQSFFLISSN